MLRDQKIGWHSNGLEIRKTFEKTIQLILREIYIVRYIDQRASQSGRFKYQK